MKALNIQPYSVEKKAVWNTFVKQSKNGTFLFERDFMEYHSDRFQDFSLLVYEGEKLLAILPANQMEDKVFSHQGLTYGGFILSKKIKFEKVLVVFQAVLKYLNEKKIGNLQLKLIPKIYQTYPADELDYLLFLVKAKRTRCDISSSIALNNPISTQSNRVEGVKKAIKNRLVIKKEKEYEIFWKKILIPNLASKHDSKPVHTSAEIKLLAGYFPKNIHQFNVYKENEIVGGATIFESEHVAHVQYISANNQKQALGTLDYLFHQLITEDFKHKKYFDFGISNEEQGLKVNKGLLYWKECFGARSVIHEFYDIATKNHSFLNDVL